MNPENLNNIVKASNIIMIVRYVVIDRKAFWLEFWYKTSTVSIQVVKKNSVGYCGEYLRPSNYYKTSLFKKL